MKKADIERYVNTILFQNEFVLTSATLENLRKTPKDQLIQFHSNLGRLIRNSLCLWNIKHKPKIVDGVDVSHNHPDAVSMRIIEALWERLQDK